MRVNNASVIDGMPRLLFCLEHLESEVLIF